MQRHAGRSTSLHRRIRNMLQLIFVVLFSAVVVVASAGPEYAQETQTRQPVNPVQAPPPMMPIQPLFQLPQLPPANISPEAPSAARPAAVNKSGVNVNFNFDDADIFEVIQTVFGDILKVNYMIDPRIKGRVNFRTITPVKRDEVLPLIGVLLKMNGAGFIDDKGLYRIVPLEEVPGTTPKVFVYPLQNTKAKHISAL